MDLNDYPHLFPALDSIPFVMSGSPVVASTGLLVTVDTPQITQAANLVGVVRSFGVRLSVYDFATAYWQFAENDNGIRDWAKVWAPGPAPETPAAVEIMLKPNQKFTFKVFNGTGAPISATYWVKGHYYKGAA